MTHMEDRGNSFKELNRSRWGLIFLGVVVAGAAMAVRALAPASTAEAQVGVRRTSPAPRTSNTIRTASNPQPPSRQTAPAPNKVNGADVLAVVNGEPITRTYIGQQCVVRWGNETIESLVNKQLITAACSARGIVIADREIDAEIASIAGKFGMSVEQYLDMLRTERNVSETEYRRDIVWPTLALKRLAADRLTVTQEQLDKEYEAEYGPKVQVRMISLANPQRAAEVLREAKANPENFGELAKRYSEDPNSAAAKGLIPPVRKHLGEPAIEQAVFALQEGQVSEVVHAANQYLIFRCERHIPEATISPQYRRQTDKALRDRIVERNLRSASGDIFKQLQQQAEIVNVWNDAKLRKQSPGVAAFVNGQQITMRDLVDECILRYGRDMLDTEINNRLLTQELSRRKLAVSQSAINAEVSRAALAFGYMDQNGQPDMQAWVKAVTEQEGVGVKEYIRDAVWPSVALKQLVDDRVQVTKDDLDKGFEANYGERVEVLAIVLGNQRIAQDVWDMARKNTSREFFGQLAEQYSVEAVSRANFGEIPPIRRHGGQPQIEKEAFSLNPNDELQGLSGIVAMGDKYIILKCLGRTTPIVESIADVQSELEKDIREKKLRIAMSEEFERLRDAAQIDNFLAGTSQAGKTFGPRKPQGTTPARRVSTGGTSLVVPGSR